MGIGFIVSLIVCGVMTVLILAIAIPMEKKYIVRENRKINFKKSTILHRWNMFDTLTLLLAIYTIICVQILNFLISSGKNVEDPFVQFFTNQSQVWVIVSTIYLITRLSLVLKSMKEIIKDGK